MTRKSFLVLLRFELASVLATAVDLGVFTAAVKLGVNPIAATPCGAACGALTNFFFNRHVTFAATDGRLSRQALLYLLVSAASLGWNTLGESVIYGVLHVHFLVARILTSAVVGLCWNFPLHRYVVFASVTRPDPTRS